MTLEHSGNGARLRRRGLGIGAFGLFLAGLLVAIDLEELVVLAAALAALCVAAGLLTWGAVRYRTAFVRGGVASFRAIAPRAVRLSKRTRTWSGRIEAGSARAGRSTGQAIAAGSAEAARTTHTLARRAAPVLRRADEALGIRARSVAAAAGRRASRAVEVIAADIHAHRDGLRASRTRTGPRVRPAAPARKPRRPAVTRAAARLPRRRDSV